MDDGLPYRNNGGFGPPEKKCSINFTKTNTKFCLSLDYNADNTYLIANGTTLININWYNTDKQNLEKNSEDVNKKHLIQVI